MSARTWAKAGSPFFSPGLKRTFSSSSTPPSARAAALAFASSPTVSVAKVTGLPSSSPSRTADRLQAGLRIGARPWAGPGGSSGSPDRPDRAPT